MSDITAKGVIACITDLLAVRTAVMFLWLSGIAGFFAGTADIVQYFRYSSEFPESSFVMNLIAGIAAFLMFASSLAATVGAGKLNILLFKCLMLVSSAMAFTLALLPRPAIGSALRPDLFMYLGGLGVLATALSFASATGSQEQGIPGP